MSKIRASSESIQRFVIEQVDAHPSDIARITAAKFKISRQAVGKHLQKMISGGALTLEGQTLSRFYSLPAITWQKSYSLATTLEEDLVWREDIAPLIGTPSANALGIWHYGFTEMLNNVIDHSAGTELSIALHKSAIATRLSIHDNGVGIFRKIQSVLDLLDERHAVLELAKGKLTTDPDRHTGEGIFFTSRMFDEFEILSGGIHFSHQPKSRQDWIQDAQEGSMGTRVSLKLDNKTSKTAKKVFDQFTSGDDYGFTKTVVPVRLAQYGEENLVSRSQAKRLLARVDKFKTVILDFMGVESIGQAFADEIFRVFAKQNSQVELLRINANSSVERMIRRALGTGTVTTIARP